MPSIRDRTSRAAAYIQIESGGRQYWGTGIDTSIDRASFKAILMH